MGGCTNCKGKAGCDDRKGSMFGAVEDAIAALYPTKIWGEVADIGDPLHQGISEEDGAALADELATVLTAATFFEPGDADAGCDYIYVLCLGRAPCLLQIRDHGVAIPDDWAPGATVSELYLRVCLSHRVRMAGVQQVSMDGIVGDDRSVLVEQRVRAGVYDAPLLPRMQKLVATLPAYDILHVDFGEISHPPEGYLAGTWTERFAATPDALPAIANYLFFPEPTTMASTRLVTSPS